MESGRALGPFPDEDTMSKFYTCLLLIKRTEYRTSAVENQSGIEKALAFSFPPVAASVDAGRDSEFND